MHITYIYCIFAENPLSKNMKSKLLYVFITCFSLLYVRANDTSETIILNRGWMFAQSGTDKWLPATVPGTVHQDLLNHELLPDPFFGTNEKKSNG